MVGYRFVEEERKVGTILENSFVWEGDESTCIELNGTCCFEKLAQCVEYSQYSTGWIIKIKGEEFSYGELDGEIIIQEARVLRIIRKVG